MDSCPDPFVGSLAGNSFVAPQKSCLWLQGGCSDFMPQAVGSGLVNQIGGQQRCLEEDVSWFGLQIRVEVAIGQILVGNQQEE